MMPSLFAPKKKKSFTYLKSKIMKTIIEKKSEILKLMGFVVVDFEAQGMAMGVRYYHPLNFQGVPAYYDMLMVRDYKIDESWELLMQSVEVINASHNMGLVGRDLMYTMELLLSGGYPFGSEERLEKVYLTKENLFERIALYAFYKNRKP